MPIKKCSKNSSKDKKGVALLTSKLEGNLFKTYFQSENTVPNIDGWFYLANYNEQPQYQIEAQIKTVDELIEQKGFFSYEIDLAFIDYIREQVSKNLGVIFIVNKTTEQIYGIILDDKTLKKYTPKKNNQKNITLHFSKDEEIDKNEDFYNKCKKTVIEKSHQLFSPQKCDCQEFQIAFDVINNKFDGELKNIKNTLFPNVWKLGIAFDKEKIDTQKLNKIKTARKNFPILTTNYTASFGVYAIKIGSKLNIFDEHFYNTDEARKSGNFLGHLKHCNAIEITSEGLANEWLADFINDNINLYTLYKFLPNEVLTEIIYNYIDMLAEYNNSISKEHIRFFYLDEIKSNDLKNLLLKNGNIISSDCIFIINLITELENRNVKMIKRVWDIPYTDCFDITSGVYATTLFDEQKFILEAKKLFLTFPKVYNDFLVKFLGINGLNYTIKQKQLINIEKQFNSGIEFYQVNKILKTSKTFITEYYNSKDDLDELYKKENFRISSSSTIDSNFYKKNIYLTNIIEIFKKRYFSENNIKPVASLMKQNLFNI